ncbi:beta-lactamase-like protein [Rhodocollybia butyracea]|uniref:Beta-lactamase-like protein n=1 Tax=Rhodocollybia butyracea TaxID=206335 RepID=A0A9P5U5D3_9AGAR|nr:beta-lactamase-like protein [Rhodocollybia butyracea]
MLRLSARLSHSPLFVRHSSSSRFHIPAQMLTTTMTVTFLGTSSGGGPSQSRNCSSLVADLLGDGKLWMVDCAEGTLRQFQLQPYSPDRSNPRLSQLKKIFITHMHADHVMGIVPILRNVLFPVPVGQDAAQIQALQKSYPTIELYGPAGLRTFVRSILKMTSSRTSDKYVVHELLNLTDSVTSCEPDVMHESEVAGKDIVCSPEDSLWRDILQADGIFGPVAVDAGPIAHRDPCIGFVFREAAKPFRKIVVLGDTNDPSAIVPLCIDPSPSLLVHEATDAHISPDIDPKAKRSYDTVKEKALARGHSIPEMAGAFAKTIGARKLVLNHIGGRFPAPNPNEGYRLKGVRTNVIAEIERQATEAWGMGNARAAWDFMRVGIPAAEVSQVAVEEQLFDEDLGSQGTSQWTSSNDFPTSYNTWETNAGSSSTSETPSYASSRYARQNHRWSKGPPDVGGGSSRPYRSRYHPEQK